jgi:hypothetical protein
MEILQLQWSHCFPLVNIPQLHCQLNSLSKSKLYYDRRSAGQSVLEQSTHLGLTTRSWLLPDSCGFVDLGRPLWREDGSVVCNCYWNSPAQSFLGPSPVGPVAIFYCLDSSLKVTVLELIAPTVLVITSRHGPHRKQRSSIVAFASVVMGTCLPSRCPETALFIRLSRSRCIATSVHTMICCTAIPNFEWAPTVIQRLCCETQSPEITRSTVKL